ncbi:MAG TPA: adenylate/guanylate cyclase domain-containing protein [Casimicrobiaceae bacterium]|nr:adenylate/guanylate cyclase domain-containing protein [Casimicrobiaceae bacterium]
MTATGEPASTEGSVQSYIHTTEIVERPAHERPARDTVGGIAEWLIGPALDLGTGAQAVDELAWRLIAAGFPLARLTLHSGVLHPQFLGTSFIWWRDTGQTVQTYVAHEVRDVVPYEHNPVLRVVQGGETLRRRIDLADSELDFPILRDLKAKGCTDYLALPIPGAHGRRYAVTYTTDRVEGFSDQQATELTGVSQRMSVACDSFGQRELTRHLLKVYLGPQAGPKVLAGQIRRGTGEELTAILWSSDLRGFTARSDRLPGQQMIAILDALFDAQATAIHQHGGEILKFIGDGLLAIFPIGGTASAGDAANNAMAAAMQALDAVRRLSDHPSMAGEPALQIVVALHAGAVIYGNVGAVDRLDFTVIGPAVNLVSRVENLAKALDEPIVVTDDFAQAYAGSLRSLGLHEFRGVAKPRELFSASPAWRE